MSGNYDLAIWAWVPAGSLNRVLEWIENALGSVTAKVYPIQRLNTPFTRLQDEPGVRPTVFGKHFTNTGTLWEPREGSFGPRSHDLSDKLKFYTVIDLPVGGADRVFQLLSKRLGDQTGGDFEHYTVCTFRTGVEEGCLLTAYTTSWERNEVALLDLFDGLPEGAQPTTYLCFRAALENDLPWVESQEVINAPAFNSLKTRALRAITDTFALRDRDPKNHVPSIEAWFAGEANEGIVRSLLTYDPEYWWDFVATVRALIVDAVTGIGDKFADIMLKEYRRLDRELSDGVRSLFSIPDKDRRDQVIRTEKDPFILAAFGSGECNQCATSLGEALKLLNDRTEWDKKSRHDLYGLINKPFKYFQRLGDKGGRLTLGMLAEVISNIHHNSGLSKERYLNFGSNPFMDDWGSNLDALARDRDLLAHDEVQTAFDSDQNGQARWESMLPNYIRGVPQARILLRELHRAYLERCKDHPIILRRK